MASEMSVAEPAPAGGAAGGKQDPVVPDIVVYLCSFMIILVVVGGVFFLSFLMKTRLEAGMNASGPGGAGGPPPPGKLLALDEGDSGDFKVLNDEDPFHYKVAKARDGSQQHKVPFYEAAHLKEKSPQHKVAKHKQSLKKTTRQKRKTTVTRQKTTKSTKATKTTRRTTKRATTKAGRKMHAKMGPQDVTSSVTGVPKTSAKADQKTAPGDLEKFAALKSKNPGLKLLVTIGGEEADDLALSQAFKDDTKQQLLTSSIATLVRNLALDGVNLHWVEPDLEGDVERDSAGLINFLKSLRNLLQTTLLAVTVPSDHEERIAVFNVKELSTVADYLFLSTHEVYSPYSAMTRFPGPAQDVDTGGMFTAISEVVQDLGQRPPKGLCFTVALHGVAYQVDPRARLDKYVPLANVTQSAHNHLEYAREGRALSYPELCSLQLNCNVAKVEKSCYDKVNDVWYGYVNEKTMASKVKWILQGGWENLCVVAWDIDMDDYAASCGTKARYPLLRSISAVSQALAY